MCEEKSKKQNDDNFANKPNRLWWTLFIAGLVVFIMWLASWLLIGLYIPENTDRGTFGDMFGAVNALFSGLAFAGLIVTLHFQKEELKLQREELAETRNELNAQKREFQEQNKTMKRQRFENTFFNMLSLQQEIVSNLSYDDVERVMDIAHPLKPREERHTLYNGRTLFREIYLSIKVCTTNNRMYYGIRRAIEAHSYTVYSDIQSTTRFDHYFRHLYHIYRYVDRSDLVTDEERYEYASIVRSQLSDYELVMLFYNCLTANGRAKFKPLIEKYAIFNNLREELLADVEHKREYAAGAYGNDEE